MRWTADGAKRTAAVTPSPLNIGVAVAANGALIDADGQASQRLSAIGPVRYGTLIETTATPEIRTQAAELAKLFTIEQQAAVS